MIQVTIILQNQVIKVMKVSGHAASAPYGKDLVCAAVSAVMTGGVNALPQSGLRIKNRDGLSEIQVDDLSNQDIQSVIKVLEIQLQTIESSYPKFIKIIRQEEK
jgi:uncharacterized protein